MEKKESTLQSLLVSFGLASVWFGIYIGPGFSGGAQLVSFFVGQSWLGVFIGPLFTTTIAGIICYLVLEYCRTFELYDFRSFYDRVFGKFNFFFANVKEFSAILACITISALTFATGGRLLSEFFHVSSVAMGLLTFGIVVLLILAGQKIVLRSASFIAIALILLISYIAIRGVPASWEGMSNYVSNRTMNAPISHVLMQIVLYINIMVAFVDAVIPASKGQVKTRKHSLGTAIIGSLMVFISTIAMNIIFAAGMPNVAGEDLPTLWSLNHIIGAGFTVRLLYTAIAYLAVLSTGAGYLYGMIERYQLLVHKVWKGSSYNARRLLLVGILTVLAFYFGRAGIPQIVTTAYGIIGRINIPLFEIPFLVILPYQLYKYQKNKVSTEIELSE